MDFNRYFNNDELKNVLDTWAERWPTLLSVQKIGASQEDKPIWMLVLTNQDTGADKTKPAVWIDANIHATEIAGTTTALRTAWELLSTYGENPQTTRLLDTSVYYIVPRINPDGAAYAMAEKPRMIRSGTRYYPWEDEIDDGLHIADVDGDGNVLQMRIRDPHGDWKVSTLNPVLMEKRKPDEHGGEYYRLLPEGLIKNFDGYQIEIARTPEGLDFNRNFPAAWRPESDQYGAGPYPASEPEIRAIVDFIVQHPNINAAVTFHTYSGVILRPYSIKADTEMNQSDLWTFKAIGERGTALTGYKTVSVFHDFKYHPKQTITGGFDDWMYDHLGAYSFTIELWDIVGRAGIEDRKWIEWFREHPHEDDVKVYEWAKENGPEDGYVDWYEYDHPQLGKVELGGWNRMFTWRNPPHHFMGEEAERNVGFMLALGDMLPNVEIHSFTAEASAQGEYRLNLVVQNTGYFPTYTSKQGKQRRVSREVRAELDLPNEAKLTLGKQIMKLGHLEGRSNKNSVFSFGASGTDHRTRTEWGVRANPGETITVNVRSDRAGSTTASVTLP